MFHLGEPKVVKDFKKLADFLDKQIFSSTRNKSIKDYSFDKSSVIFHCKDVEAARLMYKKFAEIGIHIYVGREPIKPEDIQSPDLPYDYENYLSQSPVAETIEKITLDNTNTTNFQKTCLALQEAGNIKGFGDVDLRINRALGQLRFGLEKPGGNVASEFVQAMEGITENIPTKIQAAAELFRKLGTREAQDGERILNLGGIGSLSNGLTMLDALFVNIDDAIKTSTSFAIGRQIRELQKSFGTVGMERKC